MFVHRVVPPRRVHPRERLARRVGFREVSRGAHLPRTLTRKRVRSARVAPRHRTPFRARHRGSFAREELELERQRVVERLGRDAKRVARRARAGSARIRRFVVGERRRKPRRLRRRRDAEYSLRPRRGRPRTRRDAGRCRGRVRDVSGGFRWIIPNWAKIRSHKHLGRRRENRRGPERESRSRGGRRRRRRRGRSESTRGDGRRVVRGRGTGPRAYRSHRGGETGRGTTGRVFAGSLRIIGFVFVFGFVFARLLSAGDAGPRVAAEGVQGASRPCFRGGTRGRSIPSRGGRPRAFASREGVVSEPGDVASGLARGRRGGAGLGAEGRGRGRGRGPRGGWPAAGRVQRRVRWGARRSGGRRAVGVWGGGEALERDRVVEGGADSASRERDGAELGALAKLGAREERGGGFRASGRFGAGGADVGSRRGSGRWRPRVLGSRPVASTLAEQRSRVREMKLGRAADAAVGLVQRGGPPDAADVRAGTDVAVPRFNVRADQRTA